MAAIEGDFLEVGVEVAGLELEGEAGLVDAQFAVSDVFGGEGEVGIECLEGGEVDRGVAPAFAGGGGRGGGGGLGGWGGGRRW